MASFSWSKGDFECGKDTEDGVQRAVCAADVTQSLGVALKIQNIPPGLL